MRFEIENQPHDLQQIIHEFSKKSFLSSGGDKVVFTGSGDSWAAAMFATELDHKIALAEDPGELSSNLGYWKPERIVIISISGRTRANIELAKKARRHGIKTIVVTSVSSSPLAKLSDESVILEYNKASRLTSGTISFTASLLACAKILGKLPSRLPTGATLSEAEKWASKVNVHHRGKCLFVGSGTDRALAEYGASKMQEVLGFTAIATYPEQLGHALLFSWNPSRDLVLCINTTGDAKTKKLAGQLSGVGLRVFNLSLDGPGSIKNTLVGCFHLQYLALLTAEARGQKDCAFLRNKRLLELSNSLIY